ncbi:MAG: acetate--CoA ligase family protein, partial [Candidatus Thorarchaeota archaeon]
KDSKVNGLIILLSPQAQTNPPEIAKRIVTCSKKADKPIICSFSGGIAVEDARKYLITNGVPVFPFPERAVRAMGVLFKSHLLKQYLGDEKLFKVKIKAINFQKVKRIFKNVRSDSRTTLTEEEAKEIVNLYGIPIPREKLAKIKSEAISIAHELNYPVVMKIVSPDIMHKSDIGGVKLNVKTDEEVSQYFDQIILNARSKVPNAEISGS